MRTVEINRDDFERAVEESGVDNPDAILGHYSGRGMYGDECIGFVYETTGQLASFFVEATRMFDDMESNVFSSTASTLADRAEIDSMGLKFVVYFPGVTFKD